MAMDTRQDRPPPTVNVWNLRTPDTPPSSRTPRRRLSGSVRARGVNKPCDGPGPVHSRHAPLALSGGARRESRLRGGTRPASIHDEQPRALGARP